MELSKSEKKYILELLEGKVAESMMKQVSVEEFQGLISLAKKFYKDQKCDSSCTNVNNEVQS